MTKTSKLNVQRAIAKELGVTSNQIILLESYGNIEYYTKENDNDIYEVSRETFGFVVKTSKYIVLGFSAEINSLKFEDGDKTYLVHNVEKAPQYEEDWKE